MAGPSQYMQFPRPAEINLLLVEQARAASGTAAGSRVAESAKASTSGAAVMPGTLCHLTTADMPICHRVTPDSPA